MTFFILLFNQNVDYILEQKRPRNGGASRSSHAIGHFYGHASSHAIGHFCGDASSVLTFYVDSLSGVRLNAA